MRLCRIVFAFASLLLTASCGNVAASEETDEVTGSEAGAVPESEGAGGGDASSVANESVKEKPLLKSCYMGDAFSCQVEATIASETNIVRGSLKPLAHDFESSYVARSWSRDQAVAGNLGHDGFPYERKKVLIAAFPNATWGFFAENVAMMSSRESDPVELGKQFVSMWKNSPGHYKNMIGSYSYLGVGMYKVGNNVYATQLFH